MIFQRPFANDDEQSIGVVSMFAGCGGMDLGFLGGFRFQGIRCHRLPFKILAAYDHDKPCVKTYNDNLATRFNSGRAIATHLELATADVTTMPKADVLIGGFPCQEFAQCGPRGGIDSDRGKLFQVMVDYLAHHKPIAFVAENVPGLQTMDGGQVLAKIKAAFETASEHGYRVVTHTLYAPEFGVPQTRTRIFLVGVRKDINKDTRAPKRTHITVTPTTRWAIDDLKTITDETIANQSQYFRANKAKKGHGQGDEISKADLPGYTVRANSKSRIQFHYELSRRLTVRECARLQTFPDWFAFPFKATCNMYQIGNAVPPLLSYRIAVTIAGLIRRYRNTNKKALNVPGRLWTPTLT
jgi:DNA (cytosine-5)-methyltransferase 1